MANLKEQEKWEDGVYQIEENDPVLGGENGITNKPIKQLANRTLWLKKALELFGKKSAPKDLTANSTSTADEAGHSHKLPVGSTTQKGIWQATSDTGLDSEGLVFTAKGAKKLAQIIANVQISVSQKWTAKAATETEAGILPISHKTDGTSKEKFASEYAVGEATKATKKGLQDKADRNHTHQTSDIVDFNSSVTGLIKNVVRKTYQQTKQHKKKIKIRVRKGPGYVYEDGEETIDIQTEGTMAVYPNGKIEQIIAFRNFSPTWFGAETNDNALHIPVQLWSSMPNKVDYVTVFLNKTKSGAQYASEATEWILGWAEDIQEQIKDKVTIRAVRWTGGQDEPVDLIIKVEGY